MTASARLRQSGRTVINFTERFDIKPTAIHFEVGAAEGGGLRYRVRLRQWPQLARRITPRHVLTVQFERIGEPVQRIDAGSAAAIIRKGGVIEGEIAGGFDPQTLGLRIVVSDPDRSYRIVAKGWKARPDAAEAELPEAGKPPRSTVNPLRDVKADGGSLLFIAVAETSGGWNLKLRGVDMPHLVIDPVIGQDEFERDARLQIMVLPEVVRRIVTELARNPDEYAGEPWVRAWKQFAGQLSPIGEWSYFAGDEGDDDLQVLESRVDDAVAAFRSQCNFEAGFADANPARRSGGDE